jgi:hypothetical protein
VATEHAAKQTVLSSEGSGDEALGAAHQGVIDVMESFIGVFSLPFLSYTAPLVGRWRSAGEGQDCHHFNVFTSVFPRLPLPQALSISLFLSLGYPQECMPMAFRG